jgi:hypothetical protein
MISEPYIKVVEEPELLCQCSEEERKPDLKIVKS